MSVNFSKFPVNLAEVEDSFTASDGATVFVGSSLGFLCTDHMVVKVTKVPFLPLYKQETIAYGSDDHERIHAIYNLMK